MLLTRNMKIMSFHECKWSGSLVVRWQLTDQAYLDQNLEKHFFIYNCQIASLIFLVYIMSSRAELYIFHLYLVAFIFKIS